MKEYCDFEKFRNGTLNLAQQVRESGIQFNGIYGVPRGGLILAVTLAHHLDLKFKLNEDEVNINDLVVDEISDSGKTLRQFKKEGNRIATLYRTEHTIVVPDFWVYMKGDKWITYWWEKLVETK